MIADRLRLRPVDAHSVHAQDQVAVPLLCNRTTRINALRNSAALQAAIAPEGRA